MIVLLFWEKTKKKYCPHKEPVVHDILPSEVTRKHQRSKHYMKKKKTGVTKTEFRRKYSGKMNSVVLA